MNASTLSSSKDEKSSCNRKKARFDFLLWGSASGIVFLYLCALFAGDFIAGYPWFAHLAHGTHDLVNQIWWGLLLGVVFVGLMAKVPREFFVAVFGNGNGFSGVVRAATAGVLLDMCSHGILLVGAKLYERGVSAGQVIAFLLASPWNSFSLTLILIGLIGFGWTFAFIVLSMLIAIAVGWAFEIMLARGLIPANAHRIEMPADFHFFREARRGLTAARWDRHFFLDTAAQGIKGSRMVARWMFFGILLASVLRASVSVESFTAYFGATLLGLVATLVAATIIEVCSEGSTPIASDLLNRAQAPGNGFAFLMAGVATDYTEVMVLRDTTGSWRIPLLMPLIAVPQIFVVAWILNQLATPFS